jgi:hypothetical protein
VVYGLTLIATALTFNAFWFYAARGRRLIAEDADQRAVSGISRSFIPGVPTYAIATLVAVWSAYAAVTIFAALALFYVLESSLFGRSGEGELSRLEADDDLSR